ncbi:class V chitinase Chi100 [Xylaria grammica]|nr:class V chitinase Chi100 [Xylaria grammica]
MKDFSWGTAISLAVALSAVATNANTAFSVENAANDLMASMSIKSVTGPISGRPTDLADARAAVLAGNYTSRRHHTKFRCPSSCSDAGTNSNAWFTYAGTDLDRLRGCNMTMLLDFTLSNTIDDPKSQFGLSACEADLTSSPEDSELSESRAASCLLANVQQTNTTSLLQLGSSGTSSVAQVASVLSALDQLLGYAGMSSGSCNETIQFASSGNTAVGAYAGSGLTSQGLLASILQSLSTQVREDGSVADNLMVQMCSNSSARYSLGVFISTKGDLAAIQRATQLWKNSSCVTSMAETTPDWQRLTYLIPAPLSSPSSDSNSPNNFTHIISKLSGNALSRFAKRANCKTVQVQEGDTCDSLAPECGISAADFTKYNPGSSLCSSLVAGQHVCCSSGSLPDYTPEPSSDGYCSAYEVKKGDTCKYLAAAYDITEAEIEKWNTNTWGWYGCGNLLAKYYICLSSGYPPMPSNIANAVCGPQVNDTAKVPPGTDFTKLNPCPLNACCNIWGQCGTTADFCTPSNSSTGAPGTAAPEENGCISNCGTDILTTARSGDIVDIAYFEAFDWSRPCLRMPVTSVDTSRHTHIHFSFVTLNSDFSINTSMVADQLPLFRGMTGIKKIVSIGGWSFSTDLDTYTIFRDAVSSESNRQTLVKNIVNFLEDYNLDGVDWDWEYPSEPDIPGIPAGSSSEGSGYFFLLDELKDKMPSGKTVSVTAPASYWYLQYFPIQALSAVVDYIVYMTYDLHGQWDYQNKYASPGCPSYDDGLGNCLRSHVNSSETTNALSMITKAGVPSGMIAVGVSSYGRSFKMSTPGCKGPECTYTGPNSGAWAGPCTDTPGYLADYEIGLILKENPTAKEYWDGDSGSSIVVFNETEWVAYMNETNKNTKKVLYPLISFLGTADWAVDLQSETGSGSGSGSDSDSDSTSDTTIYINPDIWNSDTPVVTAQPGATLIWPPKPLAAPTVINFDPWTTTITYSSLTTLTSTIKDGVTSTYPWYIYESWLTVLTIPAVTTTAIPVWGISLDSDKTDGEITLTSSVQPPPFTVTITPVVSGNTSIISATETTTTLGGVVTWGSQTYTQPTQTETLGGRTTITGGTTLPPTVITVTPNPHPTTVPTTTDPAINPKTKPKWTSGKPPSPTSNPGCKGCGGPCVAFCDPDCPFCPPNVFGSSGGGGSGSGNPEDNNPTESPSGTSSSSSSTTTVAGTVRAETIHDEAFATEVVATSDLDAIASKVSSFLGLEDDPPTITTTVVIKTTVDVDVTSTTTVLPPSPTADCEYWEDIFNYVFAVSSIKHWSTDGGSSLHKEEKGCGAIADWVYKEDSDKGDYVFFTLPYLIKDGCVERAIKSAGGPKLSCRDNGDY